MDDAVTELAAYFRTRTRCRIRRDPADHCGAGWRAQLSWEHTTLLAEDAHGEATCDNVSVSRDHAEQIAADLALRYCT